MKGVKLSEWSVWHRKSIVVARVWHKEIIEPTPLTAVIAGDGGRPAAESGLDRVTRASIIVLCGSTKSQADVVTAVRQHAN
jgi:hypothetical protein